MLQQQIESMASGNMTVFRGSSPASSEQLRASTPITFSQELFSSQDESKPTATSLLDTPVKMESATVNPASLSPKLSPSDESNAKTSDLTQHPAAMLCDLQCQSEVHRPWTFSQTYQSTILYLAITSIISTLLSPLHQILYSLRTASPLCPSPSILTTLIWLATTPAILNPLSSSRMNSTSTTSSKMTSSSPLPTSHPRNHRRFSLRINLLYRLLACSPHLARPLRDATLVALRSALAEMQVSLVAGSTVGTVGVGNVEGQGVSGRSIDMGKKQPGWEVLLTLLWSIKAFEKKTSGEKWSVKHRQANRLGSQGRLVEGKLRARASSSMGRQRGRDPKSSLEEVWRKALRRQSRR